MALTVAMVVQSPWSPTTTSQPFWTTTIAHTVWQPLVAQVPVITAMDRRVKT
jgi:hypothetical protein